LAADPFARAVPRRLPHRALGLMGRGHQPGDTAPGRHRGRHRHRPGRVRRARRGSGRRGDSSLGHLGRGPAPVQVTTASRRSSSATCGPRSSTWTGTRVRSLDRPVGPTQGPVDVAATGPRMLAWAGAWPNGQRSTSARSPTASPGPWAWPAPPAGRPPPPQAARPRRLPGGDRPPRRPGGPAARPGAARRLRPLLGMPGARPQTWTGPTVPWWRPWRPRLHPHRHSTAHPGESAGTGRPPPRHLRHLDDAFVDRFGVVGTPAHCVARLFRAGRARPRPVLLVEGRDAAEPRQQRQAHHCLAEEVLPALRALAA